MKCVLFFIMITDDGQKYPAGRIVLDLCTCILFHLVHHLLVHLEVAAVHFYLEDLLVDLLVGEEVVEHWYSYYLLFVLASIFCKVQGKQYAITYYSDDEGINMTYIFFNDSITFSRNTVFFHVTPSAVLVRRPLVSGRYSIWLLFFRCFFKFKF